jgi:hypothetical protein
VNTPAHLVINLAVLAGGSRRRRVGWVAAGALLPDLPMVGFFLWERFALGTPDRTIWAQRYFEPAWQSLFDLFNSMPLAAAGLLLALALRRAGPALLFASVLLHCLLDLPLHREDGHRHFFPLSDWRFMSPVSYWDPDHQGAVGSGLETLALCAACALLWRRHPRLTLRVPLAVLAALSILGWVAFYGLGRLPRFE